MKRYPLTVTAVLVASVGLFGYFSSKNASPTAPLAGIPVDSVQTELWSSDDGRNYVLTTYKYSGPNIERSRDALENGLANTQYHEQFSGDDYAYFAPSKDAFVHSIGWGVHDDGTKNATVREYWPLTPLKMTLLSLRLGKSVGHMSSGTTYIIDTLPVGSPERELMAACLSGDEAQANANVTKADLKKQDFLFWALFNDHLEVAQVLLDHGANINYVYPKFPSTTLDRIATCGHPDVVKFAFAHGAHFGDDGHTALANLSHIGSPADYVINSAGDAPWFMVDNWEKGPEIAEILFAHGAKANGLDSRQQTPLSCASWEGHAELVKVLLDHGADPNISVANIANKKIQSLPIQLADESKRNHWREVVDLLAVKTVEGDRLSKMPQP